MSLSDNNLNLSSYEGNANVMALKGVQRSSGDHSTVEFNPTFFNLKIAIPQIDFVLLKLLL